MAHVINITMANKVESDMREVALNEIKTKRKVVKKHPMYVSQ